MTAQERFARNLRASVLLQGRLSLRRRAVRAEYNEPSSRVAATQAVDATSNEVGRTRGAAPAITG